MGSVPPAAFSHFPPTLETIPEELRIPESFGWTPTVLGTAILLGCGAAVFSDLSRMSLEAWVGFAVPALLGALLVFWDYRRRRNRTVLVPQGGAIGVYRKGVFELAVAPSQVNYYQLSRFNTLRFLIFPGAALVGLISAAVKDPPRAGDTGMWIFLGVGGAVCLLLGSLVVHTRIVLKHFYVPRTKGSAEKIMLKRELAARFYSGGW